MKICWPVLRRWPRTGFCFLASILPVRLPKILAEGTELLGIPWSSNKDLPGQYPEFRRSLFPGVLGWTRYFCRRFCEGR